MFSPGTNVDIFSPADQPSGEWVWIGGYQISTSKKQRHTRLPKTLVNPLTREIEKCLVVQNGPRAFPVCQSHVRLAAKDAWKYPKLNLSRTIALAGVVIADESDKADLEAISEIGVSSEEEV